VSAPEYSPLTESAVMSSMVPDRVAPQEGVGSRAGSAGNVAVQAKLVPEIVPDSVPVLLLWQDAQVPGASVDRVVTVPETFAPACVTLHSTTMVAMPVPAAFVFRFESAPLPENVGGGSLRAEPASGMPEPAPQDASAASAAVMMIVGTGFMTPRSPSR